MTDLVFNLDLNKNSSNEILQNRREFYGLWRRSDDETTMWSKRVQTCIQRCEFPTIIAEFLLFDRFVSGLSANELKSIQSVNKHWTLNQLLDHYCSGGNIDTGYIEANSTDDEYVNQNPIIEADAVKSEPIEEELMQNNLLSELTNENDLLADTEKESHDIDHEMLIDDTKFERLETIYTPEEMNRYDAASTNSVDSLSESDCDFLGFDVVPDPIECHVSIFSGHQNQVTIDSDQNQLYNKDETKASDDNNSTTNPNNIDSNLNATSLLILTADEAYRLKTMDKSSKYDSTFISCLLTIVFGNEVLKRSSAGGRISNFNGIAHDRLDPLKLEFIRQMFLERVDGDHTRAIAFNKIVNKKCNNLRRQQL